MKTVWGIFARDVKALVRNPVALLVVLALLVLPGLYAWYCIVANWDPYSNTGNLPIAIVNKDKGVNSNLTGEVNVGKEVAEKLKDNDAIDWHFYDDEDEALQVTASSLCYATIVFPEDLSENIAGIFEGSDKQPVIYYYPNEKSSAVATKVTDSAAQTLVKQINQQFAAKVNQTLLEKVQQGVDNAEKKVDDAKGSAAQEIADVQRDIKEVIQSLDSAESSIEGWRTSVAGSQTALSAAAEQLPIIRSALIRGEGDLNTLRVKTIEFDAAFSKALSQSGVLLSNISAKASSSVAQASSDVSAIHGGLDAAADELQAVADTLLSDIGATKIEQLVDSAIASLKDAGAHIDNAVAEASKTASDMNADVQTTIDKTNKASAEFSSKVLPQLSTGTYELGAALAGLSAAIGQFEPQIGELQLVLSQTDNALIDATAAMEQAKVLLTSIDGDLDSTMADMGALGSALRVEQVARLLDIDPDNLGQFVSSPVEMVTEKIYPVSNYGTAVTPFYTNLALWVGCFILVSLIKLEVDRKGFETATTTQCYFARWLLLVILAVLQSQAICGVDILLGIDCVNPVPFMIAGAICSFAYMNLLFALVITFRNIGKTLCILLLIMQVPGSSGMYPIEIMPDFYQFIHPALPFTYGIDAMREALCGMEGLRYVGDLVAIAMIVPMSLLLGLVLRPAMLNLTQLFDHEMNKTGFFASEEHGRGSDTERMRSMMRALASSDHYRDDIEERAWKFNRRYPKLRFVGSIVTFSIPFAFVLLMLPLNLLTYVNIDVKLTLFFGMVILLLLSAGGLIVLEYVHRSIEEEAKLLGNQLLGDDFEYLTMLDQAENVRKEIENKVERVAETAADDLLSATPPLSSEVLSQVESATKQDDEAGDAATTVASGVEPIAQGVTVNPATTETKKLRRWGVIGDIFRTDMRMGLQSVIGVVVVMLLVVTPSMYAWFNISGSWDPYANTGGLKVAVANEDAGYKGDLLPLTVNVGDTIESQLRGNSSFDWQFTTEEEAVSGVSAGAYYAAIVIPKDFSRNMMTYLTENTAYPNVTYYTNEKENPIAPLITQKGADSIQESIRKDFSERVDEVGLSLASDLMAYVSTPQMGNYAARMGAHLDDATRDMGNGAAELRTLSGLSSMVGSVVQTAGVAMDGISTAAHTARDALANAELGTQSAENAFDQASAVVEEALAGSEGGLDTIAADADQALVSLETGATKAASALAAVSDKVGGWVETLTDLQDELKKEAEDPKTPEKEKEELEKAIASLQAAIDAFTKLENATAQASRDASAAPSSIEATRAELKLLTAKSKAAVAEARSFYHDAVEGTVDDLGASIAAVSGPTRTIMDGLDDTLSGLSSSVGGLTDQLNTLASGLAKGGDKLESAGKRIADTKERLAKALRSGDVQQIQQVLLGNDPSVMAERLSAPVEEIREPMYPVTNFGSSLAPFYTVLSLWVGALVMISTMRVHLTKERLEELRQRYVKVKPRHEFLGRYGIFGFIALLQSLLVLLGDLFFLHIQCVDPVLFVLLGIFIGQVFCLIVYTLTELFGDIGKAVCVILLIMQVAASGGTFPVEMMSGVFIKIAPFLPFYHAMSMLQECVAGVFLPQVLQYMAYLLIVVGIMLLMGIVVRKPFRKLTNLFEHQLEKTGYM